MESSAIARFFGVVTRPQTWLNVLFQWLAFPLGLFYFVFLIVGLALGLGLLVIWIGIPILLVMAGAWWLFGSFERLQARHLLGAAVGPAPRSWESVDGVWAKLRAHFGNGATWRDLAYLLAKLPFGIMSFTLAVTAVAVVGWLGAFPFAWYLDFHIISWGDGQGWTPAWWAAILGVPAAILAFFVALHVLNAWGWVCARWAELLLGEPAPAPPVAEYAGSAEAGGLGVQPAPLVSTGPPRPAAGSASVASARQQAAWQPPRRPPRQPPAAWPRPPRASQLRPPAARPQPSPPASRDQNEQNR